MGVTVAVALALTCLGVAAYGMASLAPVYARMNQGRTVFPVRGLRVATVPLHIDRLVDLTGEAGDFRGLIWAGTDRGLVCRATGHPWVVGECDGHRQPVVLKAVMPMGFVLFLIGLSGFMSCLLVGFLTQVDDPVSPAAAPFLVLPSMLAVMPGAEIWRARRSSRLLARYLTALLAERPAEVLRSQRDDR